MAGDGRRTSEASSTAARDARRHAHELLGGARLPRVGRAHTRVARGHRPHTLAAPDGPPRVPRERPPGPFGLHLPQRHRPAEDYRDSSDPCCGVRWIGPTRSSSPRRTTSSAPPCWRVPRQCRVIPFGIPVERFERLDPAEVAAIRERYGPRIVLGVGRLIYYKASSTSSARCTTWTAHPPHRRRRPAARRLEAEARAWASATASPSSAKSRGRALLPRGRRVRAALGRAQRGVRHRAARGDGVRPRRRQHALDSGVTFVSRGGLTGVTVPPADSAALARAVNALLGDPDCSRSTGAQRARASSASSTSKRWAARRCASTKRSCRAGVRTARNPVR